MTHDNFRSFPQFRRDCRSPCLLFAKWDNCGHCHAAAPHMKRVQNELRGVMPVYIVDAEDHSAICKRLQVRAFPTIMFLGRDRIVRKFKGAHTYDKILEFARMNYK